MARLKDHTRSQAEHKRSKERLKEGGRVILLNLQEATTLNTGVLEQPQGWKDLLRAAEPFPATMLHVTAIQQ